MKITQNAFLRKIRNINGGDWLKELKNVLTDITSDFKNENGESLLTEDKKINTSFLPISPSLEGTNYIYVMADGTDVENAAELQAAYVTAQGMSPSATNRITVIAAPGNYKFPSTFVMDTEFIDLVSLTGNPDVIFDINVVGDPFDYDPFQSYLITKISECLIINADNVYVKGIKGKFYLSPKWSEWQGFPSQDYLLPISVTDNLPNIIVENCIGGVFSFGSDYTRGSNFINVSGTFINCTGQEFSFGAYSNASGTFIDCKSSLTTFDNCFGTAGEASGIFIRCESGGYSFGSSGIATGTFISCIASIGFANNCIDCSGKAIFCISFIGFISINNYQSVSNI